MTEPQTLFWQTSYKLSETPSSYFRPPRVAFYAFTPDCTHTFTFPGLHLAFSRIHKAFCTNYIRLDSHVLESIQIGSRWQTQQGHQEGEHDGAVRGVCPTWPVAFIRHSQSEGGGRKNIFWPHFYPTLLLVPSIGPTQTSVSWGTEKSKGGLESTGENRRKIWYSWKCLSYLNLFIWK